MTKTKWTDCLCALGLLAAGCGSGTTTNMNTSADTCMTGNEQAVVITQMLFAQQTSPGVSVGFDLDNHVGTSSDPLTCGHASFTSPDGATGIDNSFSTVLPAIEMTTNNSFMDELQGAINDGMLLIGVDLTHVDSQMNDGCVGITISRLTGAVTVGTDQILNPNQTFDTDHTSPISTTTGVIKNGVLTAGPFELQMPVQFLNANFVLAVHNAHISLDITNSAAVTGVLGGALNVNDVVTTLEGYSIGADLLMTLPGLLMGIADQDEDASTGKCAEFSVALTLAAKPAFINP